MTRYLFGGIPDYVIAPGDEVTVGAITGKQNLLVHAAPVTFWDSLSGGFQYTDIVDLTGVAILDGIVTSDANGAIPGFRGPENITAMYADAGGGRRVMIALDVGAETVANTTAVAALTTQATSLASAVAGRLPALQWDLATSSYPARSSELAGLRVTWVGPSTPPTTTGYAAEGDLWEKTLI